jgi:hypothetical protein
LLTIVSSEGSKVVIAALPAHVKYVAWLDCDVVFEKPDWVPAAKALLDRNCAIQLFSEAGFPDAEMSARVLEMPAPSLNSATFDGIPTRPSFLGAFGRVKDEVVNMDLGHRLKAEVSGSANIMLRPAHGLAWAAQTSFLRQVGFYERCIIGAGDVFFCYGLTGLTEHLLASQRAGGWGFYGDCRSHHQWASRALEASTDRLGCLDGRVLHLFHGDMGERQYTTRVRGLVPFALDLDQDIYAPEGGPWSWRRDQSELNAYFLNYMRGRNEDGQHPPAAGVAANT